MLLIRAVVCDIDGRCSHMGIPLGRGFVIESILRCLAHGVVFDLAIDKVLRNLQASDIRSYPIIQEGDEIFVEF